MTSRATRFALGALTCILASASGVVMPLGDADAADECVASPKRESPPGRHWYYRVDRSTKRHCWYLGATGKTGSSTAGSTSSRRALFAKLRREESRPDRTTDAHAELTNGRVDETLRVDDASLIPPKDRNRAVEPQSFKQDPTAGAAADDAQSLVASRWPKSASTFTLANEQPKSSFAVASAMTVADLRTTTEPIPGTSPAAMSTAEAAASKAPGLAVKRTDSLYTLLCAFGGALVLVSIAGGASYFMTGAQEQAHDGWPSKPFDVTRSTSWLDPAANISDRFARPSSHRLADLPRQGRPAA